VQEAPTQIGTVRLIVRRPAVDERGVVEPQPSSTSEGAWSAIPGASAEARARTAQAHTLRPRSPDDERSRRRSRGTSSSGRLPASSSTSASTSASRTCRRRARVSPSATPRDRGVRQAARGCAKFSARFREGRAPPGEHSGPGDRSDSPGMNARVTKSGTVRVGDRIEAGVPLTQGPLGRLEPPAGT
jgi:hypothetical protein